MSPRRRRALRADPDAERRVAALRATVTGGARDYPGIYRWIAPDGEVLYVGKSSRLRTRLLSYFRLPFPREKGARMLREAGTVEWDELPTEFAALLAELRAIKRLRPRYNVMLKRDARHFAFVRLHGGRAPRFDVVRSAADDDGSMFFGPFRGAWQLQEALRELNDALGLRDCRIGTPIHFADQPDLLPLPPRTPGCIRHEIGRCLGPCVGAVAAADYARAVGLARDFLFGRHDQPLAVLRDAMAAASEALEFERAAALRDKAQRLESLRDQFARLRFALESLSFVYVLPGRDGDDRAYVIHRARVKAERPAPRTPAEREALQREAARLAGLEGRDDGIVPANEVDEVQLVAGWFARRPKELVRAEDWPLPRIGVA